MAKKNSPSINFKTVFTSLLLHLLIPLILVIFFMSSFSLFSTFGSAFQNKWNNMFVTGDTDGIIEVLTVNNDLITPSKVKRCNQNGFYRNEEKILYFCQTGRIFQFEEHKLSLSSIKKLFIEKYIIILYTLGVSFIFFLIFFILDPSFYKRYKSNKSNNSRDEKQRIVKEFFQEIMEDVQNNGHIGVERTQLFCNHVTNLLKSEKQLYLTYYYRNLRILYGLFISKHMTEEKEILKKCIIDLELGYFNPFKRLKHRIYYYLYGYNEFSIMKIILFIIYYILLVLIGFFSYQVVFGIEKDNNIIHFINSMTSSEYPRIFYIIIFIGMIFLFLGLQLKIFIRNDLKGGLFIKK